MLDPTRLRYLFYTDACGGIRQAAEELKVNPSSISRQIAVLEGELQLTLLEKHGRKVKVTETGSALCEYYRTQRSADIQLRARLDEFRNIKRGLIRLSMGEGFGEWVVNGPLRAFQTQYPGIDLDIRIHPTDETVRAILEDEADIGVTYFAPNDRDLKFHARSDVPICVVVHRDHPLTRLGRDPRLTDVVDYPIGMLHPEFGGRQVTDLIARSENVVLRPSLTANSYAIVRKFVLLGEGVFLMPFRPSPQRELDDELVPLPLDYASKVTSQTQVITRSERHLTNAMRMLIKSLIESGQFG
ncbi:LysR family transcriptional regulator [Shinella sumterensis]|jgi:DNA-binding transcriptional LysR family regulator|uniref:LysR substrate-binding domain-containing protein n=1 Tax=Shinella sumterensis TaxID=1967501 RepID=A0AA50CRZ8_9HYPH|nr:LysR substrate-binding domain-containing protein [Shinella sumterensis]MCD1262614.1 LysR family transcriptional regulator [Shinella sumterensis]WLS00327.1 LysR substrate-binding domain-containing protein [Shinella sumterensis]WLS11333.1 LysR substrate-binding domain-containing protein [Shinella sumterensis]